MFIDWLTEQTQRMLSTYDAGLDEIGAHFDFALSSDLMNLLYAQNEASSFVESEIPAPRQEKINGLLKLALDEYELALA